MLGSVSLTWNGATKLFFVNRCGAKVNVQHLQTIYKQHLQKELLSAVQHLCIHKDWISEQCTITPFKLHLRFFTKCTQFTFYQNTWMTPLLTWLQFPRFFIWSKLEEKLYGNRLNKPFENERIEEANQKCMERYCLQSGRDSMSNQKFAGRLRAVKEREGQCIEMIYG